MRALGISKPIKRNGGKGISARALPRAVIAWLDAVAPQPASGGWQACAVSAITEQQQFTGFDCGVACLLYAEKAAQRQAWQDIRAFTNQAEITEFRTTLYDYFRAVGLTTNSAPLVLAKKGRPRSAGRLRAFAPAGRASKDTKAAAGRRRKGRGGSKVTARPAVQPAAKEGIRTRRLPRAPLLPEPPSRTREPRREDAPICPALAPFLTALPAPPPTTPDTAGPYDNIFGPSLQLCFRRVRL